MDGSIVFVAWHHCAPQLMHASLGPTKLTFQAASRSVWPLCRAHDSDRQTERPRYSVCNNSPRRDLKTTTTIMATFIGCWRHGKAIARVLRVHLMNASSACQLAGAETHLGCEPQIRSDWHVRVQKSDEKVLRQWVPPPPTWGVLSHVESGCRSTPLAYAQFHKCNAVATCC